MGPVGRPASSAVEETGHEVAGAAAPPSVSAPSPPSKRGFRYPPVALIAVALTVLGAFALAQGGESRRAADAAGLRKTAASSYAQGEFEAAVADLERAVELDREDAASQRLLGQAYEAQGRLDDAAKAYTESLEADASQPEVLYALAIIHKTRGRTGDAIDELERAVGIDREFFGARLALADLLAATGRTDEAREQYRAVLDAKPYGVDLDAVKEKLGEAK